MTNSVNQKGAKADGDVVGRDKIDITNVYNGSESIFQRLWNQLHTEIQNTETTQEWVESLQFYREKIAPDGVVGLEAKLEKSGRSGEEMMALRQKEMFVKLLTKYELFSSAQEILAFCLHRIQHEFDTYITPTVGQLTNAEIDAIISERIV